MLTLLPSVAIGEKILMLCVGTGRDRQLLAAGREPLATVPTQPQSWTSSVWQAKAFDAQNHVVSCNRCLGIHTTLAVELSNTTYTHPSGEAIP